MNFQKVKSFNEVYFRQCKNLGFQSEFNILFKRSYRFSVATLVGMGFKIRFALMSAFGQLYFTKN